LDCADAWPSPERIRAQRVLVVGDAMLDRYWFGSVDRVSPEAPIPIVHVQREEERLGGAANVASNLRALGVATTLLAFGGQDDAAERLCALTQALGVQALLHTDPAIKTIVKLRVIGRSQQLLRLDFEGAPTPALQQRLLEDFAAQLVLHDAVILSDYGKGALQNASQMIALARRAGVPVLVDPKGDDYAPYAGATAITPNRAEFAAVAGRWADERGLIDKAQALRERLDLEALVVTRSEEGISIVDAEGHCRLAADAREVYDVTGAGDTVIACLAALRAAGCSIRQAAVLANRAGGIVVGRFGTASVTYEELLA
jgi:D-glycero-beta-D-manno-heptose-7-phosphate kinase